MLLLILASDDTPYYVQFQEAWATYMQQWPEIDWYFYKANPSQEAAIIEKDHCISIKMLDTLDTVWQKTLAVFEYMAPRLSEYDYIVRPNLSTFFIFERYINFLDTLPKSGIAVSVVGTHISTTFPSGCCMAFTPDIVQRLASEKPPYVYLDDVTIGAALMKWRVPIIPLVRHDITNNKVNCIPDSAVCVRIKGPDRYEDVHIFESLTASFSRY